jgi:hypothetical protein
MSIFRRIRLAGVLLALIVTVAATCLLPSIAHAQSISTVTGTVSDTSGAAVPGASIKLIDTRTNAAYFGKTAGDGTYRLSDLPPGPGYSLSVTKDGFQVFIINNLYLPVATATTQDVTLQLGTVSEKVEVTAQGSVSLDTTDTAIGNNLDMHAVASLPNEFRDNPGNLLRLEVGVVSAQTPSGSPTSGEGAVDPNGTRDGSVAGAHADQNNIIVDGIDATDFAEGLPFVIKASIPVEAIQEFNTEVANPLPQYGGRGGAQTIITTKSGSNQWHGTLYEYNRNAAGEANTYFNRIADVPRSGLIRNQFGGNVGGPVWKDKLFFFFEYDGRRDRSQAGTLAIVPFPHVALGELAYTNDSEGNDDANSCIGSRLTAADVSTNCVTILRAAQVAALDPCSHVSCAGTPGFAAPGTAPALASLFATRYRTPNNYSLGDGVNTAGLQFNAPDPLVENNYLARSDFNINQKNKMFARFNFRNVVGVANLNEFPNDPLTSPAITHDRAWVIGETWTANPNFVNQFTYGETHSIDNDPILFNPEGNIYELTFFSGLVSNPYFRQTTFGIVSPESTWRDDITYMHGKHTFTFGAELHPTILKDALTNDFTFIQQGLGGNIPSLLPAFRPADIEQDPDDIAQEAWDGAFVGALGIINDLQAGISYTGQGQPLPQGTKTAHSYKLYEYAGYFQDTWRLKSSLTVTLGVRYQYQGVPYEVTGRQASVINTNFADIMATRVSNGEDGISGPDATPLLTYSLTGKKNHAPALYNSSPLDFAPRLGLAWNPSFHDGLLGKLAGDRKTVLRANAGVLYDENVANNIVFLENQEDYTFANTDAQVFGDTGSVTGSLETSPRFNSVTSVPFPVNPPAFVTPVTPPFLVFNQTVDDRLKTPYEFTTSLGIQRELPGGFQVEADYYGRFNRHLFTLADAAQLVNFTDPSSKQTLAQAFTTLEKDARQNTPWADVPNQPFFENQMNAALGGPGSCLAILGSSCTQYVYQNFGGGTTMDPVGSPSSQLGQGDTAFTWFSLPSPPNVGFTPQFDVNAIDTSLGSSSYNALFVTVRKRLTRGLQFDVDYTYSHAIDNNSDIANENGNYQPGATAILCDATNPHVCRGNSEFDAKHAITTDFVYDLPFGRGKSIGNGVSKLVDEAIGGWQVSGIQTWRTGLAFTADSGIASTTSLAADPGEIFVGPRSALETQIHVDSTGAVQLYKNPSAAVAAYVPPTGVEMGTRDNLRGPHFSNLDFGVAKNFPLYSERYILQFRTDAFNVFNHTNFGFPNTVLTSPQFGDLTSEAGNEASRVLQFSLRFQF